MKQRLAVLGLVALAMTCGRAACADAPPATPSAPLDLAGVLANVAAAAGKEPSNEIRSVEGDGDRETEYRIGDDRRFVDTRGPIEVSRGTFQGLKWHQTANGQTVLEQPAPGNEPKIPVITTLTRVATPVDAFVINALDKRGYGSRRYVDPATWRVVRREDVGPAGTRVTTYSDFRTVDGYTQPFAWTSGYRDVARAYTLVRYDPGKATPADVAMTAPRRALVRLPAGGDGIKLPVVVDDDKFLVRLDIGGRGLDFQLDTGASGITIDENVAKELKLPLYGSDLNDVNTGAYRQHTTLVPDVAIGPIAMHDVAMTTLPDLGDEYPGRYKVVGLLGFDFIADLVLRLDYEHGTVTAYDPATFQFPKDEHPAPVPIRVGDDEPMTDVRVNGDVGERFILDTGAQGSIIVNDYFLQRYPDAIPQRDVRGSYDIRGVGGTIQTSAALFSDVELGNAARFKDFVGLRVEDPRFYRGFDGLIGTDFLRYFTVYLDFGNSTVYLLRNGVSQ